MPLGPRGHCRRCDLVLRTIKLGEHRFHDLAEELWHRLPARVRSVYKEPPEATFIPDARERVVVWGTLRIQDCRHHFRRRGALPGEAQLNRLMRTAGHDLWRREESCVWCCWNEGTGHDMGGRVRELRDGVRLRTCGVMEAALEHVLFELELFVDDRIARSGFTDDGWLHYPPDQSRCRSAVNRVLAAWSRVPGGETIVTGLIREHGAALGIPE